MSMCVLANGLAAWTWSRSTDVGIYRSREMKVGNVLLAIAACLSCSAMAAETIRLGTWNIERLGEGDEETTSESIANYIQRSRVDILALQEIKDTDPNRRVRTNTQLRGAFELRNRESGAQWRYRMFPNRRPSDTTQLAAVAWNSSRVEMVGSPMHINVVRPEDDDNDWDRHPHAIKFSAGNEMTDIVVISVHMKSGQYEGPQRLREAKALVEQLDAVRQHFDDTDIVILGDFNCRYWDDPPIQAFVTAGFRDLNRRDAKTFKNRWPFDRILVPSGGGRDSPYAEFQNRRLKVHRPRASNFYTEVSDHILISMLIGVAEDDD